jgi:hypothetical protein
LNLWEITEGISDSWTAHAKINGHPRITELHIAFRLGDYLRPLFASKSDLMFFSPLFYKIDDKAKEILPKESKEDLDNI